MNANDLTQQLQKGFHVTLGATTALVESLQDSQKREENIAKLSQEWSLLSAEWEEKGANTEQEARNFMSSLLSQPGNPTTPSSTSAPNSTSSGPSAPPAIQLELQELTAQIAAMRAELEKLRNQDSPS